MIDKKKLQNIIETIGIRKLLLILALGICLMVFSVPSPEKSQKEDAAKETQDEEDSTDDYVRKQEERLVKALKQVEGVGKVKVMITVKSSSEAVVNKDSPYEESTGKEEKSVKEDEETVLIEEDGKKFHTSSRSCSRRWKESLWLPREEEMISLTRILLMQYLFCFIFHPTKSKS